MTLAVLCPGQGGQRAGLFDGLALADRVADVVAPFEGRGDPRMFDNAIAQPALCAFQMATWSRLGPRLAAVAVEPALFAGYSVGELAAHGCAGAFGFDDTIALARSRADAMDAASRDGDGLVAVRGLGRLDVEASCARHGASIAIVNDDDQYVVGGSAATLDAVVVDATARGARTRRLPVAVAAHTPLLESAATAFRRRLEALPWSAPSAPIVAGIDGAVVRDRGRAIDALSRQVATTVRWSQCMDSVVERGATVCLELGPGNALARLMRERHPDLAVRSVSDFRSLDAVVEWVARNGAGR